MEKSVHKRVVEQRFENHSVEKTYFTDGSYEWNVVTPSGARVHVASKRDGVMLIANRRK